MRLFLWLDLGKTINKPHWQFDVVMKKMFPILIIFLFAGSLLAPGVHVQAAELPVAKWTFMVYMSGDNELERLAVEDLNEMELVGSTDELNIVVQFDRDTGHDDTNGDWTDTRRFLVQQDNDTDLFHSYVEGHDQWSIGETNMGTANALQDFLQWSINEFPAQRYALIMWGHGRGWKGVSPDGSDYLEMTELRNGILPLGKKLDLIGFDVCNQAMVEVFYQLRGLANLSVASEKEEDDRGLPYDLILDGLASSPYMDGRALGTSIVNIFVDWSANNSAHSAAQSLIDLDSIEEVVEGISKLSNLLTDNYPHLSTWIRDARNDTEQYHATPEPVDLFHFASLLESRVPYLPLRQVAGELLDLIDKAVIVERHWTSDIDPKGTSVENAHGLGIWFPVDEYLNPSYLQTDFGANCTWWSFLQTMDLDPQFTGGAVLNATPTSQDLSGNGLNDTLRLEFTSNQGSNPVVAEIYDNMGKFVAIKEVNPSDLGVGSLEFDNLPAGYYNTALYITINPGSIEAHLWMEMELIIEKWLSLSGNVQDTTGRTIQGAKITLTNLATNARVSLIQDSEGFSTRVLIPKWISQGQALELRAEYNEVMSVSITVLEDGVDSLQLSSLLDLELPEEKDTLLLPLLAIVLIEAFLVVLLAAGLLLKRKEVPKRQTSGGPRGVVKYENMAYFVQAGTALKPGQSDLERKRYENLGELILTGDGLEFNGIKRFIIPIDSIRVVDLARLSKNENDPSWLRVSYLWNGTQMDAYILPTPTRIAPTPVVQRNIQEWHDALSRMTKGGIGEAFKSKFSNHQDEKDDTLEGKDGKVREIGQLEEKVAEMDGKGQLEKKVAEMDGKGQLEEKDAEMDGKGRLEEKNDNMDGIGKVEETDA